MQVRDVMVKNVISVAPDDTVSTALAKMRKNNINQLLVVQNNVLYGMLELKKIVTRDIDPATTKVASISFNTPTVDVNTDIENAAELLLRSGQRALPVMDGTKLAGIISETDLMKVARSLIKDLNVKVSEIASPADYVEKGSYVGKVKRIMLNKNISRVPVVENNKVVGIVEMLDLIRLFEGKERMPGRGGLTYERGTKEKLQIEKTPVEVMMRSPNVLDSDKTLADVIDLLKENEEIVLEQQGKISVLTHKDILELFAASPKKQLYVQITGMQDESIEFKVRMDKAVNKFVKKMGKIMDRIEFLVVHVEKMRKQGPKEKYSVRVRFKTSFGLFVAHSWGWRPQNVIDDVFKNLEREVLRKYGKIEDMKRIRRRKERYI